MNRRIRRFLTVRAVRIVGLVLIVASLSTAVAGLDGSAPHD